MYSRAGLRHALGEAEDGRMAIELIRIVPVHPGAALAPPATTQFRLSAGAVKSAVLTLPVAAS